MKRKLYRFCKIIPSRPPMHLVVCSANLLHDQLDSFLFVYQDLKHFRMYGLGDINKTKGKSNVMFHLNPEVWRWKILFSSTLTWLPYVFLEYLTRPCYCSPDFPEINKNYKKLMMKFIGKVSWHITYLAIFQITL